MSERLGLYKRLMLELNRATLQARIEEHELHQLFWECTLRCNLNCVHCGSDCRMLSEKDDMPLADFVGVLDEIKQHEDPAKVMVITTGGEPTVRPDLANVAKPSPNAASCGAWFPTGCCSHRKNSTNTSKPA